jgi:hypothetical protein
LKGALKADVKISKDPYLSQWRTGLKKPKGPVLTLKEMTAKSLRIPYFIDLYLGPSNQLSRAKLEKYCLRLIKRKARTGHYVDPDQERARMLAEIVILRKQLMDSSFKINAILSANENIAYVAQANKQGNKRRTGDWRIFGKFLKEYYSEHQKLPSPKVLTEALESLSCHYQVDAIEKNLGDAKRKLREEGPRGLFKWLDEV